MTVLTDIGSFHRIVMETHILDSLVTLTPPSTSNYMCDFTDVNTRKMYLSKGSLPSTEKLRGVMGRLDHSTLIIHTTW